MCQTRRKLFKTLKLRQKNPGVAFFEKQKNKTKKLRKEGYFLHTLGENRFPP